MADKWPTELAAKVRYVDGMYTLSQEERLFACPVMSERQLVFNTRSTLTSSGRTSRRIPRFALGGETWFGWFARTCDSLPDCFLSLAMSCCTVATA